jgi:transcription elongation factor GreA
MKKFYSPDPVSEKNPVGTRPSIEVSPCAHYIYHYNVGLDFTHKGRVSMTNLDKQPMTKEGKAKLEAELKRLIQVDRPEVIRAIEEARSNGDLTENADYDAAKERQGFIEARIGELQTKIANAEVVDTHSLKSDRVIFGAHVVVMDLETEEEKTYQIVGEDESEAEQGRISVFSPLGRSLIGKKKSDVVELKTPKGDREFEVLKFFFK